MRSMVALIDANIVLNYITDRVDPYREECRRIISLCAEDKIEGYIAFHSVSIIWYSLHSVPNTIKRSILKHLLGFLTVISASHKQVIDAIQNEGFEDFEDCLQLECAKSACTDCIVTCNTKDYAGSSVMVFDPSAFLEWISE